jgi:hypothetical protein
VARVMLLTVARVDRRLEGPHPAGNRKVSPSFTVGVI